MHSRLRSNVAFVASVLLVLGFAACDRVDTMSAQFELNGTIPVDHSGQFYRR